MLSAYDAESNNLNATMTSIGFTVAGKKNLDKIEGYPAPETPDESKSRSDITAKQVNISDDASEDKSENNQDDKSNNNPDDKSDNSASETASPTRKGDETPTKSKKDAKSKGKKGKDDEKKDEKSVSPVKKKKKKEEVVQKVVVKKKKVKKEYFTNSPDLTAQQRDYESKLLPRHYKDNICNTRMHRFEEIESVMSKSM